MEFAVPTSSFASSNKPIRVSKPEVHKILDASAWSSIGANVQKQQRKASTVCSALQEIAASVAIAATVVGAAATFLVRRTKASETNEIQLKTCEDCGGSGICSECNGEGFVLKKLSEGNAERARLPKKWSYCTKCSSVQSCIKCDGRRKVSY